MQFSSSRSVEDLRVVSRFESLREKLLSDKYSEHLRKPLAYWALPTDRRLPLAFLGRRLDDLLNTPFVELSATPGIGSKKIRSFVQLLTRAANTDPSELSSGICPSPENGKSAPSKAAHADGFDPGSVSEVVWEQWRATVVRWEIGDQPLGRFAPSLKSMTRVIWNSPLDTYVNRTLAEIRGMKTHGEKRVRAILEVFYGLHKLLSGMERVEHLAVRLLPRRIDEVEAWVSLALQTPCAPDSRDIFDHFVSPLLEQIRADASEPVIRLAENRLGLRGPITSVRQAARTMGLTRARVYQLLNEINDIAVIRWPMGRHQVYELREKFEAEAADRPSVDLTQFRAAIELFYPANRRGAAGPLDQIPEVAPRKGARTKHQHVAQHAS